jgi:hypothetical protein
MEILIHNSRTARRFRKFYKNSKTNENAMKIGVRLLHSLTGRAPVLRRAVINSLEEREMRKFVGMSVFVCAAFTGLMPSANAAVIPGTSLTPTLWVKADQGVTFDAANLVSSWADQSGNGNNPAQSNVANQPLYVPNAVNGKPVLRFDGLTDSINSPTGAITGDTSHTIILVTKFNGVSGFRGGMAYYSGTAGGDQNSSVGVVGNNTGDPHTWAGGFGQDNAPYTGNLSLDSASFHILDKVYTSTTANYRSYLDGVKDVDATGDHYNLGNSEIGIGRQFDDDAASHAGADIAEVIVFSQALSDSDRQAVEGYLSAKYAIAPEPATVGLMSFIGMASLLRRRRK